MRATLIMAKKIFGGTMRNTHRDSASLILWLVCSVLLAIGFSSRAEAISFSTVSSGACVTSGNQDVSGFCQDGGIDYSELTGNLTTSVHFQTNGVPNALDNLNRITGLRSSIPGDRKSTRLNSSHE